MGKSAGWGFVEKGGEGMKLYSVAYIITGTNMCCGCYTTINLTQIHMFHWFLKCKWHERISGHVKQPIILYQIKNVFMCYKKNTSGCLFPITALFYIFST